jgi:hypothetical protein
MGILYRTFGWAVQSADKEKLTDLPSKYGALGDQFDNLIIIQVCIGIFLRIY